jgi:hypothetical protein
MYSDNVSGSSTMEESTASLISTVEARRQELGINTANLKPHVPAPELRTWTWQAGISTQVLVTPSRAARLKRMGEAVWPHRLDGSTGLETGSVVFDQDVQTDASGLQEFEIWVEGFRCTGGRGKAWKAGIARGEDFRDACYRLAKADPSNFGKYFDRADNTWWGCRIYDNAADATQHFG